MDNYVLIIGGCGGIGSAIVKKYYSNDFKIIVADINKVVGEKLLFKYGNRLKFLEIDVLCSKSISSFIHKLEENKFRLSHIISLAGGALDNEFGRFQDMEDDEINKSIQLNLTSHILLTKNLLQFMSTESILKSITYVSSINAKMDFGLPSYSAAKAGLIGLTKVLASELGQFGIRVNTVLSGTVLTENTKKQPKDIEEYKKGIILGEFVTPKEIADVIFSISTTFSSLTGQEIIVDSGQTSKGYFKNK
ncbi:MAG: SDR family oxidoreductase [Bacteroidales bacterium]|nr:SDR family oxidoreductase [Bacteroidales bacterium]